jgi:hemerythrin-like domain-containing protein
MVHPYDEEEEVTPTEDLMREHGILNRLLLVYEEGVRRMLSGEELPPDALHGSARIIRTFVEEYHERLEENWIFPRFEKAGRSLDLVQVLRKQHDRGRVLTDTVLRLTTPAHYANPERRRGLAQACALFIRMYRPHEAREDTVLFPQLRKLVSKHEFAALGEQFEREERRRFGEDGFERVVDAVAQIEKRLSIYDLARFTP